PRAATPGRRGLGIRVLRTAGTVARSGGLYSPPGGHWAVLSQEHLLGPCRHGHRLAHGRPGAVDVSAPPGIAAVGDVLRRPGERPVQGPGSDGSARRRAGGGDRPAAAGPDSLGTRRAVRPTADADPRPGARQLAEPRELGHGRPPVSAERGPPR